MAVGQRALLSQLEAAGADLERVHVLQATIIESKQELERFFPCRAA